MKKTALAAIVLAALHTAPAHADSVYCVNCSTSAMQALEKALANSQLAELKLAYDQYVQQTAQQIQMVQQNIEQYANMVQNTVQLPAHLIQEVSGELSKLGHLTGALHTMRNDITGMATVFDELYRTRDEFRELASLPRDMLTGGATTYRTYWDNWSDRVDESTRATFQLSASQLKDLEDAGKMEAYINELLSTPDGQQKALMAGNQLAALQIQESRQLRELIATKFQADMAGQSKREKVDQMGQALHRQMVDGFGKLDTTSKPDPF